MTDVIPGIQRHPSRNYDVKSIVRIPQNIDTLKMKKIGKLSENESK